MLKIAFGKYTLLKDVAETLLLENKKRIACDQIFPEKVMHKNVT